MTETSARRALVVGATGVVGQALVERLLADPTVARVTTLVRCAPGAASSDPRLFVLVADFGHLDAIPGLFDVDEVYCAIGTTIKQAGSPEAFRQVDYDLPLRLATLAKQFGVPHFLLVSALGASPTARVLYSRVKGELESAIGTLQFAGFTIARPSMLLGPRAEFRPAELLLKPLSRLLPAAYRGVFPQQVAAALVAAGRAGARGARVIENRELTATVA